MSITAARTTIARARASVDRTIAGLTLPRASWRGGVTTRAAVVGFHARALGIGKGAQLMLRELEQSGVPVRSIDVTDRLRSGVIADIAGPSEEALIFHINPDVLAQALLRMPRAALKGRRRIGYWVWELEAAPRAWRALSPLMDDIWAPSQFAANALSATLQRDVFVVPHAVALEAIAPMQRAKARAQLGLSQSAFVAAASFSAASSLARKNPFAAIEAFKKAFKPTDDAILVLRCLDARADPVGVAALAQIARQTANVHLIQHHNAPDDTLELEALYAARDCYLSLHRAEGFGLNLAEALLRGIPVVATAWSGNLDFMDTQGAWLIPSKRTPVRDPHGAYRGGEWAEPEIDAAAEALRNIARRDDAVVQRAAVGQQRARAWLSGGAAAQRLRADER